MTVKTILSRKGRGVVTIEPSAALEVAIATLAEHRIGALVVLGADGRVIGILSERDIVRTFAECGVRLQMVWDNLSCLGTEALARLA